MEGGNFNFLISRVLCLISSPYVCFREGKTNAHMKGDYQRIGDVMLRNMRTLKVNQGLKEWNPRIVESFFFLLSRMRVQGLGFPLNLGRLANSYS